MKNILYIIIAVLMLATIFTGCISQETIDELEDDIDDLKDEISDLEDDNEDLEEEIAELNEEKDAALEYSEELTKQVEKISQDVDDAYDITFSEYYAQLVYLTLVWDMDMLQAPDVMNMDTGNIEYAFLIYPADSDTTCSNYEIYIATEPESGKVVECTVVIVQDEEYRGKGDAYTIGYNGITEVVLSALILAQYSPYDSSTLTLELLEKIRANDSETCAEYNICYDVYEDAECEARFFYPCE